MYNELFFHDGVTGQIILPVLRPGNSHSNRWYVGILSRIIKRIRAQYPDIKSLFVPTAALAVLPFTTWQKNTIYSMPLDYQVMRF